MRQNQNQKRLSTSHTVNSPHLPLIPAFVLGLHSSNRKSLSNYHQDSSKWRRIGSFTVRFFPRWGRSASRFHVKIWDWNWISTISLGQDFLRCCHIPWQFFLHFLLLIGKVPFKYQIMTILEYIPLINIPGFFKPGVDINSSQSFFLKSHKSCDSAWV